MPTFLYFAYGSNMLTARLTARCASARPVSVAYAKDHQLTFWKKGRDASGKGHLAASPGATQPGVLFTLDAADLEKLDAIEGVGHGYRRADKFQVRRKDTNEIVAAATYIATAIEPTLRPYDWYLQLVIAGAREHGFDAATLSALEATPCAEDPEPDRPTRREALALLQGRTTEA